MLNEIIKDIRTGIRYRIIAIVAGFATLCEMDTEKLQLTRFPCSALTVAIDNGDYKKEEEPPSPVFNPNTLPPDKLADYTKRRACMKELEEVYGPDLFDLAGNKQKPEANRIMEKYGFKPSTFRRMIRGYLQSGKKESSLVDRRCLVTERGPYKYTEKPGRKAADGLDEGRLLTDEDYANFDDAIRYMKTGHNISLHKAFDYLNNIYYSTRVTKDGVEDFKLLPETERPTFWQFYYYVQKTLSTKDKAVMHTSDVEFRNSMRPLLGKADYRVYGPCDMVEIDACEVDESLRDAFEQCVGRTTVYFMVDVYSRMILAVSVAFNQNSWVGLSNLFINLGEDKQKYCEKYGIGFTDPSVWPSGVYPRRIRMDRGADMTSKEMKRVCNKFNIEMQNVTGASGSLKGTVEQTFRQLQSELNAHFIKAGLIEKAYGSKHHKESTLDAYAYTKAVIAFVLEHNRAYFETYGLTPDMIEKDVNPIPVELWEYGIKKYGAPDPIADPVQYFIDVLTPAKAIVTRRGGIIWDKRYYIAYNDPKLLSKMIDAGDGGLPHDILYDPRTVDEVYYVQDGRLIVAPLNEQMPANAEYKGKSLADCRELQKKKRKKDKRGRIYNDENHAYTHAQVETIVNEAKEKRTSYSDTKHMTEARAQEKARVERDYLIGPRLAEAAALPENEGRVLLPDEKPMPADKPGPEGCFTEDEAALSDAQEADTSYAEDDMTEENDRTRYDAPEDNDSAQEDNSDDYARITDEFWNMVKNTEEEEINGKTESK